MRETVADEGTLTLTITGRAGSWLVSGVLGDEDLALQGMGDEALAEMLRALLPTLGADGAVAVAAPRVQRPGRHRRAG
ncbi:hypothetical protein [Pseudonocardia sp. HH130630-07]|uniref:hypothetical protein n=1 Tax=Pseudonocardia sp. HH130630-07 TaxID=1690815 RepID=UPI0008153DCC|nr:hypothetical protein [Pseudonocardia sp. HH130630-07]ANY05670.1 hypothetical protein AFB00_04400 [Pseudonocardia sp. HH130630-07]